MSVKYEFDSATNILTARPEGTITVSAIREYFSAVVCDVSVGSVRFEVVLFEGVTDFAFAYSATYGLEQQYSVMRESKGIELTLFLAPQDLQFGIARMLSSVLGETAATVVVRDQEGLNEAMERACAEGHS